MCTIYIIIFHIRNIKLTVHQRTKLPYVTPVVECVVRSLHIRAYFQYIVTTYNIFCSSDIHAAYDITKLNHVRSS